MIAVSLEMSDEPKNSIKLNKTETNYITLDNVTLT